MSMNVGGFPPLASAASASPVDGLTVTRSDPLPAGPLAVAALPDTVEIALVGAVADAAHFARDVGASGWTMQRVGLGSAQIDLDGYRLTIDDIRAELVVDNLASGQSARVWGDATFEAGEAPVGRFWGTTSLQLANGLFITCGTAPAADNPNLYHLDRLTITKGANAIVVSAIGGAVGDDMAVTGTERGWGLEEDTADGLVLVEGARGWLTEDRRTADEAYLAQTAPGGDFGPGEEVWSQREFGRVLSRFVHAAFHDAASTRMSTVMYDFASEVRRADDASAASVRAEHRRAALYQAALHARPTDLSLAPSG